MRTKIGCLIRPCYNGQKGFWHAKIDREIFMVNEITPAGVRCGTLHFKSWILVQE